MIWTIVYLPFVLRDFLPQKCFDLWLCSQISALLYAVLLFIVTIADHLVLVLP